MHGGGWRCDRSDDSLGAVTALTDISLTDANAVCGLFARAAEATAGTRGRTGCVVDLPDRGRIVLTGDLHDHLDNYQRILKLARINYSDHYHVVFQEVIHGDRLINGHDLSYRALARIAQLKLDRPDQVHQILSNHELSQLTGDGILKDGVSVIDAFRRGLMYVFAEDWEKVDAAIGAYVRSMPLAVRCANGVLCAHSLPAPRHRETFDAGILGRPLKDADLAGDGSAHLMVWGRGLAQTIADELAAAWNVKLFVLGHQHVDMGFEPCGQTMLILNSDHEHGVALPVDLDHAYSRDELCEQIVPLNSLV
jgi:hypothetical protein